MSCMVCEYGGCFVPNKNVIYLWLNKFWNKRYVLLLKQQLKQKY